jgi:hypothetical protein
MSDLTPVHTRCLPPTIEIEPVANGFIVITHEGYRPDRRPVYSPNDTRVFETLDALHKYLDAIYAPSKDSPV